MVQAPRLWHKENLLLICLNKKILSWGLCTLIQLFYFVSIFYFLFFSIHVFWWCGLVVLCCSLGLILIGFYYNATSNHWSKVLASWFNKGKIYVLLIWIRYFFIVLFNIYIDAKYHGVKVVNDEATLWASNANIGNFIKKLEFFLLKKNKRCYLLTNLLTQFNMRFVYFCVKILFIKSYVELQKVDFYFL
jgi:hypothetical protein